MTRTLLASLVLLIAAPAARAQDLPAGGPGRDAVVKRCISCHEADLIVQQRLSRTGWQRSLEKMMRWGATVDAEERDPMLDYLAAHFAPRPVPSQIVATAGSEAAYKQACLSCHDDDLITAQRLTRTGWQRSVEKMVRWGAHVPAEQKEGIVSYLAARYPPR